MKTGRFLGAASVALLMAGAANAALITLTFSGTATNNGVAGAASTFTGSFIYDTSVAAYSNGTYGQGGTANYSDYNAIRQSTFQSGTVSATLDFPAPGYGAMIEVGNATNSGTDIFSLFSATSTQNINAQFAGPASVLNSTALPTSIDLNSFSVRYFSFNNNGQSYTGTITSLSTSEAAGAVPEPATWAMMLLGFGAIGAALRGQRRVAGVRA